ncbi:MAG: TlpA family protein disulfide reductase [Burkholderiales bacterium]|nr:TlpA family protein disulfide reductase [Burkholderiales bacterium]
MPIVPTLRARARRAAAALAVLFLLASASATAAGALRTGSGEPAPPLALRSLDGTDVRLAEFRGRTVLVNFWATWCAPCVVEMPSIARLRTALRAEGFEVLAVNVQENAARIRPFVERLGLDFPVLRDHDGSARRDWDVRVFPSTFVVGPDGSVALVAVGELDWDAPEVIARVRAVMRGHGATPAATRAARADDERRS